MYFNLSYSMLLNGVNLIMVLGDVLMILQNKLLSSRTLQSTNYVYFGWWIKKKSNME